MLFCGSLTHLGFLKNIRLSFWQTYSKPTSSNDLTSSGFSTILSEVVACRFKDGSFDIDVSLRIVEFFVSQEIFDVENVLGPVVFLGCFPMSEGVKAYAYQS
jgi:hypothetical protein